MPRRVREVLDSRIIEFEVREGLVTVRPVQSVAGGLAAYARKGRPFADVRAEVWKEVACAEAKGRSA